MPDLLAGVEIVVRLLRTGERLPDKFRPDPVIDVLQLDPEWVWVAERDGQVIGFIVAADCHKVVHVLRATIDPAAPRASLLIMLRQFFADCRTRGAIGFFSYFNMDRADERQLARIVSRIGGRVLFESDLCVGAPLPKEGT